MRISDWSSDVCSSDLYFAGEAGLREAIDRLWQAVDWSWHTRDGQDVLYWHWSPRHDWAMDHPIRGWNECLITYVLAAASPTHPIVPAAYHNGWTDSAVFRNGRRYHGIELPLGPPLGGPLFFSRSEEHTHDLKSLMPISNAV